MARRAPRKRPRQERSKAMVQALIEATERVLAEDGFEGASTNRIAKAAGVSVGSLYQYFPNKEALFHAVMQRHLESQQRALADAVMQFAGRPLEEAVRSYIALLIDNHLEERGLNQAILSQALSLGMEEVADAQRRVMLLVRTWLVTQRDRIVPTDLDTAAFVLVTACESAAHAFALGHGFNTDRERVIEEVCALVLRYLLGSEAALGSAGSPSSAG